MYFEQVSDSRTKMVLVPALKAEMRTTRGGGDDEPEGFFRSIYCISENVDLA